MGAFSEYALSITQPNLMVELFDSFDVNWLPANHPWRQMTVEDAKDILQYFELLSSRNSVAGQMRS